MILKYYSFFCLFLIHCFVRSVSSGPVLFYTSALQHNEVLHKLTSPDAVINDNSESSELSSLSCIRSGSEVLDSLPIRSLSYDPISRDLLMQVAGKDDSHFTVVIQTPPCQQDPVDCSNITTESRLPFYDAKGVENGRVGPFAYYNSSLYFLVQRFVNVNFHQPVSSIELRQMSRVCSDGTVLESSVSSYSSRFDLIECSKLLANVTYEAYRDFPTFRQLDALTVVASYQTVFFYFQIYQLHTDGSSESNVTVFLYSFRNDTAQLDVVHKVSLRNVTAVRYLLYHMGGITVVDRDIICWSYFNAISCAKLKEYGFVKGSAMSLSGDLTNSVCTAPAGQDDLKNIISGVAATRHTHDVTYLFFGCVAQTSGVGGLGRITLRQSNNAGQLFEVDSISAQRANGSNLYAGGMILLDNCPSGHFKTCAPNIFVCFLLLSIYLLNLL